MKKKDYNEILERIEALEKILNGGKGSGNWGHLGRPGQLGGSGKGDGSLADVHKKLDETGRKLADKIREVDDKPIEWRMSHEKAWDKLLGERDDARKQFFKEATDWVRQDKKLQKKMQKITRQVTGDKGAKLVPVKDDDPYKAYTIDFGGRDVQIGKTKYPGATGRVKVSSAATLQAHDDGVSIGFAGYIESKRGKLRKIFDFEREPGGKVVFYEPW